MNTRALPWFALPLLLACGDTEPIVDPGARCGDGVVDPGEACDDGVGNSDVGPGACRRDCTTARCGDGVVDPGEDCDEGTGNDDTLPDSCRTSCAWPFCGDGVIDRGEACDAGERNGDGEESPCRTDCSLPRCGDGVVDELESCDEGAANSNERPDACRVGCKSAWCGDGVADSGEECDRGSANDDRRPDTCRTTCRAAFCGDGVLDTGESCDDGDENSDTNPGACRTSCVRAHCGDGVVDPGEACDDGDENSDTEAGACRTSCVLAHCGDGVVDSAEACDDGSDNSDLAPDACRTSCVLPTCGDGVRDTGEGCDHGEGNANDASGACRVGCVLPICGDGVVDPGEDCDPGEGFDDITADACRTGCRAAFCGDGVVDTGEFCDDGNDDDGDGCGDCRLVASCSAQQVHDLAGGLPWTGAKLVYQGSLGSTGMNWHSIECNPGEHIDVLHALHIPTEGDIVVSVAGAPDFVPAVELRGQCSSAPLTCAANPLRGTAVAVARSLTPDLGYLWIVVEAVSGAGDYQLVAELLPPLAHGAVCHTDGRPGTCAAPLTCADPDGDGTGTCAPLVAEGAACDPAGESSVCVESVCSCPTPGCTAGVCSSTCGDGTVQPWEECDDGDPTAADNCTAVCEQAGRSCAAPFRLDLAPVTGGFEWSGTTESGTEAFAPSCGRIGSHPEVYGTFTAPEAGNWVFQVIPENSSWRPVLSLLEGGCDSGVEFACSTGSDDSYATKVVPLGAGQAVWPIVDRNTTSDGPGYGRFVLRAERMNCGDGALGVAEECDDGNLVDDDNCSNTCTVAGKSCAKPFDLAWDSVAREAVWTGDASLGHEASWSNCSDNLTPNDSVARFKAPEAGDYSFELWSASWVVLSLQQGSCGYFAEELACEWTPEGNTQFLTRSLQAGEEVWVVVDDYERSFPGDEGFTARVRPAVCGDGIRIVSEECDDGNVVPGDGCSSACKLEFAESEPNDSPATATAVPVGSVIRATIGDSTDQDWFSFQAAQGATYDVQSSVGHRGNCLDAGGNTATRLQVELFDDTGVSLARVASDGSTCPRLSWTAQADGTYFLRVNRRGQNATYYLELDVSP